MSFRINSSCPYRVMFIDTDEADSPSLLFINSMKIKLNINY